MDPYARHVVLRDGPSGQRAVLRNGPDVWEVVTTEPEVVDRDERIHAVAEYLFLRVEQVEAAFAYYDAHRQEIDSWVAENHRVASPGATAST